MFKHTSPHYTSSDCSSKMHFLHPSSPDCCQSELDLFSVNPTQISVSESNFISINPVHAITNTDVPLEFNIPGTSDQYLDPSNVFLYLKTKLVTGLRSRSRSRGVGESVVLKMVESESVILKMVE